MFGKKKRPCTADTEQGECVIRIQGANKRDLFVIQRIMESRNVEYSVENPPESKFRRIRSKGYKAIKQWRDSNEW